VRSRFQDLDLRGFIEEILSKPRFAQNIVARQELPQKEAQTS